MSQEKSLFAEGFPEAVPGVVRQEGGTGSGALQIPSPAPDVGGPENGHRQCRRLRGGP